MAELNERQQALVSQVEAGKVREEEPDTEVQLLTLARLGLIRAVNGPRGHTFEPLQAAKPKRTRRKSG